MTPNTPDALRTLAIQNSGAFTALFARAPKSITYKGKTYLRDSARSVEQRLWYLGAASQTQPSAVRNIAMASYSLDEVYGLDPDRSGIDDAERRVREAETAQRAARSKVDGLKRMIRSFEDRERDAARRAEACKTSQLTGSVGGDVLAGILTLGGSAVANQAKIAACLAYENGQVQLWRDRQQAFKTGAMVGMAGQEGFTVPVNDGLEQNEAKLSAATAEVSAAKQDLAAARAAYDAEARKMRLAEEEARRQQAADEAAAQRAAQEAAARDAAAAATASASAYVAPTDTGSGGGVPSDWPDYSYEEEVQPDFGDEYFESEDLDSARDLLGDGELSRAYAEDVLGVDDADAVALADLGYISPWSFDAYYGADCGGGCDGHCETCDGVAELRAQMLDNGWGFDGNGYEADKLGDAGEQGESGRTGAGGSMLSPPPMPTGSADAPFDFTAIIPLIIAAVIAIAPLILKAFGAPIALEDANPPKSTIAELPPPPLDDYSENKTRKENAAIGIGLGVLALKFIG